MEVGVLDEFWRRTMFGQALGIDSFSEKKLCSCEYGAVNLPKNKVNVSSSFPLTPRKRKGPIKAMQKKVMDFQTFINEINILHALVSHAAAVSSPIG